MSEREIPEEHGEPPNGHILDARTAKARHRERTAVSSGLVYLRELSVRERAWMADMVRGTARAFNVDFDDLMQDLNESLLTCTSIDRGRTEVRGWLRRRARWRAGDLIRRDRDRQAGTRSLDEVSAPEPAAAEPVGPDPDWSVQRLRDLGLNRDEAQAVLLTCWNLDIPMQDFAALAGRSYPKVRKDRSRGLRKIQDLFDLTPAESAALIAYREFGTHAAAAVRLGIPVEDLCSRVRQAQQKIDRALDPAGIPNTENEDDSDAC